jgi:hypothetical protein
VKNESLFDEHVINKYQARRKNHCNKDSFMSLSFLLRANTEYIYDYENESFLVAVAVDMSSYDT